MAELVTLESQANPIYLGRELQTDTSTADSTAAAAAAAEAGEAIEPSAGESASLPSWSKRSNTCRTKDRERL